MDKKTQARDLYFQSDYSVTEIADALQVPRRTLHHWIKENNWEMQKQIAGHMPMLLAENCYELIARFQKQLLSDERKEEPITRHEVNLLHKLVMTTNKLKVRATASESMEMMAYFMESVSSKSPEMADNILPFVEDYISARVPGKASQFQPRTTTRGHHSQAYESGLHEASEHHNAHHNSTLYEGDCPTPIPHVELSLPDFKARREVRPSYDDFIVALRRQEENLKHLYPPLPQNTYRKAA